MEKHFNSLPHAEVDRFTDVEKPICIYFNSLPHAEVDGGRPETGGWPRHFNSLPHAEVDAKQQYAARQEKISTHYLTQR